MEFILAFLLIGTENIGSRRSRQETLFNKPIGEAAVQNNVLLPFWTSLEPASAAYTMGPPDDTVVAHPQNSVCSISLIAGTQVEEPFCIMTVDAFCAGIEATVTEILNGCEGQPRARHMKHTLFVQYVVNSLLGLPTVGS